MVLLQITFAPIGKYIHKMEKPTHKVEEHTHKMEKPTHKMKEPTHKMEKPTHKMEKPTHKMEEPTHKMEEPAHKMKEPTHKMEEPTHKMEEPAHKMEEPTHKMEEHTHKLEKLTHKMEEPTHKMKEPAHKMKEPAHKMKEPAHKMKEPSHKMEEPAHKMEEPTHKMKEPTHKMEEPAHKMEEPTHKMEEPTHKMKEHTHKMEEPAHKMEKPTHKMEEPTHKKEVAELKVHEMLQQYFAEGKDSFEIILAGKMSTGKSTLANSIVGKRMAEEGNKSFTETTRIVCYTKAVDIPSDILKKTIDVMVWDTPGLGDPFGDDEATAKEIAEKCKEADLLVYCLDIRCRFANDDATGIKLLTEALGQQMWNHAVFALTFANEVKAKDDRDAATELRDKVSSWTDAIKRLMKEHLKFPDDIADNISIIPTGYRCYQPPGIDDWFSPFWAESFIKTKPSAQPSLLGINMGRLSVEGSAVKDRQGRAFEGPHMMPIRLSAGLSTTANAVVELVTGTSVAGSVGAAIGAAARSGLEYVGKIFYSIFRRK